MEEDQMSSKAFFVVVASCAALMSPRNARAQNQWSTCDGMLMYCDSFIYSSSTSGIYGYAEAGEVYGDWMDIRLQTVMTTPSGDVSIGEPVDDYAYVEVDVSYSPWYRGTYVIRGDADYLNGSPGFWDPDGSGYSNAVWIEWYPGGETTTWYSNDPDPNPWGAVFQVFLQPSYYDYDGGQVSEYLYDFWDGCYAARQVVQLNPPQPSGGTVYGGNYTDHVWADDGWVSTYNQLIAQGNGFPSSCGWGIYQDVSYDGVEYVGNNSLGMSLDGSSVQTYRAGGSVTVPWP